MDREHGPPHKTVGSISRLPIMPRASRDNLRLAAAPLKDSSLRSNLPCLSNRYGASRIAPPVPLGESRNRSIADQSIRSRNRSPVRDALQAARVAALETTPPSSTSDGPVFNDNDENPIAQGISPQKRRPRPSLTERTLETLSQIPPSPSPTRRRKSVVSNGSMGPPIRPASNLRQSRPSTPSTVQSISPQKQPFRPPGRMSPTKETPLPTVPSPGSLFSPPKAFVKGGSLRPVKSVGGDLRSMATSASSAKTLRAPVNYSAKTMRIKPSSHEAAHKNLAAVFKDPGKPSTSSTGLAVSGSPRASGLLKPRSIGENTIASSPPSKAAIGRNKANSSKPLSGGAESAQQSSQPAIKSSAALRDTIAKAKAAKKTTAANVGPSKDSGGISAFPLARKRNDSLDIIESNQSLLKQKIKGALASGMLNISAMRLTAVPVSVMKMYDSKDSSIDWFEMVDLTRFNAADNEIEMMSDEVFPDWSAAEMDEDEEKSNQFGGLEGLDLHNNLLLEIPLGLRRLERLTSLNLSGNKLSNTALEVIWQIPNLHEVNISRNALSGSLSLAANVWPNLQVLNLRENKIEQVEIAEAESSLRILDLSSNSLRQFPWQSLAKLCIVELNLSNNDLGGIAFEGTTSGFDQLRDLDLSRNAFNILAEYASQIAELQTVRLSSNRFKELPEVGKWQSLVTLQVANNQLTDLPFGLANLTKLRNLDVGQNNIKVLDPSIASIEALMSLEIAGNPMRDRKFLTMDTTELKLELQKRLQAEGQPTDAASTSILNTMNGENDSDLTSRFRPVNGTLDLASKGLTTVDVDAIDLDSETPAIHTLRLSNNDLTALPFALLSHPALKWSLKSLDISHNPQLHPTEYLVEDLFLPLLSSLYVVSTGLTSLDGLTTHLKAPALTELNISCHRLEGHVPWIRAWFPSCTSLLASDNWFSSIDVEAARGLEILDIRNNYIEEVPRRIGLLGNHNGRSEPGRLRVFECGGNKFRVPRITIIEKGTEAVLRDLRRMVPETEVPDDWKDEI